MTMQGRGGGRRPREEPMPSKVKEPGNDIAARSLVVMHLLAASAHHAHELIVKYQSRHLLQGLGLRAD